MRRTPLRRMSERVTGDDMLAVLAALANPHRLRVLAALQVDGRSYVSQLARKIGISRPLLHLHLQKLEAAGLVTSAFEVSEDGKALKFFTVADFSLMLSPEALAEAAATLTVSTPVARTPKSNAQSN